MHNGKYQCHMAASCTHHLPSPSCSTRAIQKVFSLFTSLIPRKIRGIKACFWVHPLKLLFHSMLIFGCALLWCRVACQTHVSVKKMFWKLSNHRKQRRQDHLVRSNHSYATMSKLRNPAAINPPAERQGHFPLPCQRSWGDCPPVIAAPRCCPTPVA